jgi:hypothetical protein
MNTAGKVGAELALDVLREATGVPRASFVEEGFEVLSDELVEKRSLRAVLCVASGVRAGREGRGAAMASRVPWAGDRSSACQRWGGS